MLTVARYSYYPWFAEMEIELERPKETAEVLRVGRKNWGRSGAGEQGCLTKGKHLAKPAGSLGTGHG